VAPLGRFAEWRTLRRWGKLPTWKEEVASNLLRLAREGAKPLPAPWRVD